MKINITIDVGNDAMSTGSDVAHLLNEVGDAFREYGWTLPERFRDANGNTVCRVVVDDGEDGEPSPEDALWWVFVRAVHHPHNEQHGPFTREVAYEVARARAAIAPAGADVRVERYED